MRISERLKELGIELPEGNPPAAAYTPGVKAGDFIFTAGQTPKVNGKLQYTGKLGAARTVEEGRQAARLACLSCLAIIDRLAGGLDNVERIVKVTGFVNAAPDFTQQSQVIDGASQLLYDIFGEAGAHARSAVGCASLPGDASCEIEMIVKLHTIPAAN